MLLLLPLSLPAQQAVAGPGASGPTVAQLLAACARGRAAGDLGVDAAICDWYAVPCDCAGKRRAERRWCMPAGEPIDAARPEVLAALRKEPRQSRLAISVVPEVMARLYPCGAPAEP